MSPDRSKYLRLKKPVIYYPVLLLVLFVLTKIQIREVNPKWNDVVLFFIFNLSIYLLAFRLLTIISSNRFKVILVEFLFFVLILFYHKIKVTLLGVLFIDRFLQSLSGNDVVRGYIVSFVLILLTLGLIIMIVRYKGSLVKLSLYFNILMIFLILFQLYTIFSQNTGKIKLAYRPDGSEKTSQVRNGILPDIYYLILDGYTSNKSLIDYWSFNNNSFTDFLTQSGFWIASESQTNYNMTPYSLASSLNMSYLTNIPQKLPSNAQKRTCSILSTTITCAKYLLNMVTGL